VFVPIKFDQIKAESSESMSEAEDSAGMYNHASSLYSVKSCVQYAQF